MNSSTRIQFGVSLYDSDREETKLVPSDSYSGGDLLIYLTLFMGEERVLWFKDVLGYAVIHHGNVTGVVEDAQHPFFDTARKSEKDSMSPHAAPGPLAKFTNYAVLDTYEEQAILVLAASVELVTDAPPPFIRPTEKA